MNFHINLILDTESRSGSDVSLKFILRLAGFLFFFLIGTLIFLMINNLQATTRELKSLSQQKQKLEPLHKEIAEASRQLDQLQALENMLTSWQAVRLPVSPFLSALQPVISPNTQLTDLKIITLLTPDSPPVWKGTFYLRGKVCGENAVKEVKELEAVLSQVHSFSSVLENIEVKRFAADETQLAEKTRVFEIEGQWKPRPIAP